MRLHRPGRHFAVAVIAAVGTCMVVGLAVATPRLGVVALIAVAVMLVWIGGGILASHQRRQGRPERHR